MRNWTILVSVLIVGTAIAVGVWFYVSVSTEDTPDLSPTDERQTFLSFFGEQFGFLAPADDQPFEDAPTEPGESTGRPSFRETLAREKILPISGEMLSGTTFTTTSTTTTATSTNESVVITQEYVRYVERETGHVNELSLESGGMRRVTNTTVPGVQGALWGPNGSFVALRYLSDDNETVETFVSPLSTEWTIETGDLVGIFFPQNITALAVSPVSNEIFYLVETADQSIGRIADIENINSQAVFVSSLQEWLVDWETDSRLSITTKPSWLAVGVSNWLDRTNGSTDRIVSARGITTLPNPSGTRVLYAVSTGNALRTYVLTTDGQETFELPLRTLPEKCVWINSDRLICAVPNSIPGEIPDSWYQGRFSFTDTLWEISVTDERVNFLYAPEDTSAGVTMDIVDINISSDGTVASFINKKDLRGWVADITNN